MHEHAIVHLRTADPALARIIDRIGDCHLAARTEGSHFDALVRAIVYQQLSGKAAATIYGRVLALHGGNPPTPEQLLATDDHHLRAAGLSRQKTVYVKDLATKVLAGDVDIDTIDTHPDDEIIERLTLVKGIGRWSAQMFLLFRLGRLNVLPELDLGVQKGIQHTYGLRKLPGPKDVLRIAEGWTPYASVASWYMWRVLELPDVVRGLARPRPTRKAAKRKVSSSRAKRRKPRAR
jgi:DNA-3-methyladenine glycosylase II